MLTLLQSANLAVRFALEIGLLTAVGYAAWRGIPRRSLRLFAVIALPLLTAFVWATVVHGTGVPGAVQVGAQVVLFTAAVIGLVLVRRSRVAAAFAAIALGNAALMTVWAQ